MTIQEISLLALGVKDMILGAAGGGVSYLFDYSNAKRNKVQDFFFVWSSLIVNVIIGAFVGYMVGTELPTDTPYRTIIVGLSGVSSFAILYTAQSRFMAIAIMIIDKIASMATDFIGKFSKK